MCVCVCVCVLVCVLFVCVYVCVCVYLCAYVLDCFFENYKIELLDFGCMLCQSVCVCWMVILAVYFPKRVWSTHGAPCLFFQRDNTKCKCTSDRNVGHNNTGPCIG